ncbi:Uncharacterized protein Adt_28186 [Abeliophyllum distichum]|uniref:Uncharacterized protein n=1 Tax=Abeliophyllum distichum TaxID=126358 RepID=A0ABD1RVU0_9LAMI
MITEEIINENIILHRNRGGVAPNQEPRMNYGRGLGRPLSQPHQRRRAYPTDLNSGIRYVASAQEGLLPPYPIQEAPGSMIGAYNYIMTVPTYYKAATSALYILFPRQESPSNYCCVNQSYGHSTEECREVENLDNKRKANLGPRRRANTRQRGQSPMRGRQPPGIPVRHPRSEGVLEHRLIKGPEKAPICEIDTIYGGPYIRGQTRNVQESYTKEAKEKLMTNWLINSRLSGSSKVDPIFFTGKDMRGVHYPYFDALVVRTVVAVSSEDIDPRITGTDSQTSSVEELENFPVDLII